MIALDLSRLLSRASATPSGIDRVELAYAEWLMAGSTPHCFAARHALGGIGMLPRPESVAFVSTLARLWRDGGTDERSRVGALARRLRQAALLGGARLRQALRAHDSPGVYLLVSHRKLDWPGAIARFKRATDARFVCLIHDLIPLDQPALTRPRQVRRHARRIATVAALANAVIVNSTATREALAARLGKIDTPIAVAPLGLALSAAEPVTGAERRYFVCIGTIEARKNQSMLLDVWRRLAAEDRTHAPMLHLIGQRGFGAGAIVHRIGALGGLVVEHGAMPDAAMTRLLLGARALLQPSLAEGFGLPVIEALALGVPVVCSDLPALRESGGGVPDYLDAANAEAWHQAVVDYSTDSPRRHGQLARFLGWQAPSWKEHFAIVERLIATLR